MSHVFQQKDEVDGEIDLKSCVKVSEFDVEKNYGFQIQVRTDRERERYT